MLRLASFFLPPSQTKYFIAVFKHEVVSLVRLLRREILNYVKFIKRFDERKNVRSSLINFSWINQWNVACNAFVPFYQSNSLLDLSLSLSISEEVVCIRKLEPGNEKDSPVSITYLFIQFFSIPLHSRLAKRRIKKIEKLKFKNYHHFFTSSYHISKRFPNFINRTWIRV